MTKVVLSTNAKQVRAGLDKPLRKILDKRLRHLVANATPDGAIRIAEGKRRWRIQIEHLTVGYEIDPVQDLVLVKVILFDTDGSPDGTKIATLIRSMLENPAFK